MKVEVTMGTYEVVRPAPCEERPVHQDDQWRWLVLVSVCVNVLVNSYVSYNGGVLNLAVMEHFQSDPILTSWLVSVYLSMFALASK